MSEIEFAPERVEAMAAVEHEQWAHWTRYMLDNLTKENIDRWRRQIDSPYEQLTEREKESDRDWAVRALRADAAWQTEQAAQRAAQAYASVSCLEAELERDPENASLQINLAAQRKLAVQAISDLPRVPTPEERASKVEQAKSPSVNAAHVAPPVRWYSICSQHSSRNLNPDCQRCQTGVWRRDPESRVVTSTLEERAGKQED